MKPFSVINRLINIFRKPEPGSIYNPIYYVKGQDPFVDSVALLDLEKVICGSCGGRLHIMGSETGEYDRHTTYGLECAKCNGKYIAFPNTYYRAIE